MLSNRIVSLAATVALLGAGCGSPRLSKTQYAKEANVICADMAKQYRDAKPKDDRDQYQQAVSIALHGVDGLRALKPPPEFEGRVRQMLAQIAQAIIGLQEAARSLGAHNENGFNDAKKTIALARTRYGALAAELGLSDCTSANPHS